MNLVQTRRLTQEMADTYQRALTGGPFYAAAWLLIGVYGGAFSRSPLASWDCCWPSWDCRCNVSCTDPLKTTR